MIRVIGFVALVFCLIITFVMGMITLQGHEMKPTGSGVALMFVSFVLFCHVFYYANNYQMKVPEAKDHV